MHSAPSPSSIFEDESLIKMAAQMLDQLLRDMELDNMQSDHMDLTSGSTLPPYEGPGQAGGVSLVEAPPVYDRRDFPLSSNALSSMQTESSSSTVRVNSGT